MQAEEFWKGSGLEHIVPQGFGQFPEGFDVPEVLRSMADETQYKHVIDFGCGYGRLCESFAPEKYLGVDINEKAIAEAKSKFQKHQFSIVTNESLKADLCLAYSVFLHLSDKALHEALRKLQCKWLLVAEVLGKEWRREGLPPVFNRELTDYIQICRSHDFILHKHETREYKRYKEIPWYEGKNTDISFLLFKRCFKSQ